MNNNTLPSAKSPKSNRAKVKQKLYNKPHMIIPQEDFDWVLEQKPSVIKLWGECWKADPYGSRWMQLNTSLKRTAFTESKKILEEQGLFIFRAVKSIRDSRETVCWSIKNLHGARIKEYWESIESADANNNTVGANDNTADANDNTADANAISSKTLTQQASQNPSVTPHKHLSNSSKEILRCGKSSQKLCVEPLLEDLQKQDLEIAPDKPNSENLVSHLEAAIRGVIPPIGVIHQLRDSNHWVGFTQAARVHRWNLAELLKQNP